MAHKKLNPYNAGGPPSTRNPYTKGAVQPGGRKYGFETKSDKPSPRDSRATSRKSIERHEIT